MRFKTIDEAESYLKSNNYKSIWLIVDKQQTYYTVR